MFERFSDNARQIIVRAQRDVIQRGHVAVTPTHLLLAVVNLRASDAQRLTLGLGVSPQELIDRVESLLPPPASTTGPEPVPFSPEAKQVLELALRAALERNVTFIASRHVLLGLVAVPGPAADLLADLSCSSTYIDAQPWAPGRGDLPPYDALVEQQEALRRQVERLSQRVQALEERSGGEG